MLDVNRGISEILAMVVSIEKKFGSTREIANIAKGINFAKSLDKEFVRIVSRGGVKVYEPRNEPWKMRSAMIADPEGNLIEIASDFWE